MPHRTEDLKQAIHHFYEGLFQEESIQQSRHKRLEHVILLIRNLAAALAVVLFAVSLFRAPWAYLCKGVAYFLGAAAYVCEIVILTDCFHTKVQHSEMFMAYCFGPMYLLLGVSYFIGY